MKIIRGSDIEFVPASHEDATRPGVFKRVLATREDIQQGRVQMLNWARLPGHSAFQAHYHEDMQEVFVIITGEVQMRVADVKVTLRAGDAILVDAREIHEMHNDGDQEVEYLVFGVTRDEGGRTVVV